MKVTLEFNLPEESEAYELAFNGWKYKSILDDLDNWLRTMSKYEDKEVVSISEVREFIIG